MNFSPTRAVPAVPRCQAVAVLVDGENISAAQADSILSRAGEIGPLTVLRVYGDARRLGAWHEQADFRLIHAHSGKNVTDMLLAIEAVELSYCGAVDGFVLASNDRDFAPLAQSLRARGFPVLGLTGAKAPAAFVRACTSTASLTAPEPVAPAPGLAQSARDLLSVTPMHPNTLLQVLRSAGFTLPDDEHERHRLLKAAIPELMVSGSGIDKRLYLALPAPAPAPLNNAILALLAKGPQSPGGLGKWLKEKGLDRPDPTVPWSTYLARHLPQITITGTGNDTRFALASKP